MATSWRDLTAHRCTDLSWFISFGTSMWHTPEIWLPSVVSNIMVHGVIAMSFLKYLYLETLPDRGWRTNAFLDRLTGYLISSASTPSQSWLFGFRLSPFIGIPIVGNTRWYGLILLLRSNCRGCKGILDLREQTWIFHANHIKRVSGIWKSL